MANSIFITATQRGSGKSALAMGLITQLERILGRVAFFKPIGRRAELGIDPDVRLMKEVLGLEHSPEDMVAVSMDEVVEALASGTYDQVIDTILSKYKHLADTADFVVCEGTDYFGAMASFEFDINADMSKNLGSPVVLVANAAAEQLVADEDDDGGLIRKISMVKESLDERSCELFGVIINRVPNRNFDETYEQARLELEKGGIQLLGIIPRTDLLEHPSLEEIAGPLQAEVISGHDRLNIIVRDVAVAAMTLENVLSRLKRGTLIVVPGDRDAILVGMAAAYISPAVMSPSGVVMTGGFEPGGNVRKLFMDLTQNRMPVLKVQADTYPTALAISDIKPQLIAHNRPRIEAVKALIERYVRTDALLAYAAVDRRTSRVTPKQFIHRIKERARADRRHIVLAEGSDERILRAAEMLLARKIVDLTLLGDEKEITSLAGRLGLNLEGAAIIDPSKSEWREPFARRYVEVRPPHKRPTWDVAFDQMSDPVYFATMMVYEGRADGMVAGAITTTAHTLRPALEFIKTTDEVSIASSVFFMCLPDAVLVYGDCAVNPNPTAEQLADIAIASAATARAFEIKPVVAMLSYSTGDSGGGQDVEKVRQATKLVKERNPSLLIEGPIQYDAAVDREVAETKLPGSRVGGEATVFIFPDLDSGNNTYKAVQRSAKAIAIGPVMQGLRKPVNDLSRGCTVPDIVNTVAITAIQAQRS